MRLPAQQHCVDKTEQPWQTQGLNADGQRWRSASSTRHEPGQPGLASTVERTIKGPLGRVALTIRVIDLSQITVSKRP
jgi:hypothetical protein